MQILWGRKGLLADIISLILTGDKFPIMTYSHEVADEKDHHSCAEGELFYLTTHRAIWHPV